MSRGDQPIERRWREGGGDPVDDRIGGMLRQVADPGVLAGARLERLASSVEASARPRRRARRTGTLRWAMAVALVLGTGGAVFARHELGRMWSSVTGQPLERRLPEAPPAHPPAQRSLRPKVVVAPAVLPPVVPAPTAAAPPAAAVPPAVAAPPPATARVAPKPMAPARAHAAVRTSLPAPSAAAPAPPARIVSPPVDRFALPSDERLAPIPLPPPAPASPPLALPAPPAAPGLGDEARLVRRALEELRHDHDPAAALASLDEHRARFRRGLLRADAELVRVEALLALDREREALVVLEGFALATLPGELQVIRGELRAAHDCGAALADFDRVLAGATSGSLLERALRGRAVCCLRLGDPAADGALRAYLARFPQGRFAPEAQKRLQAPR